VTPGSTDRPRGSAPAVGVLLCVLAVAAAGCGFTGSVPATPSSTPRAPSTPAGPRSVTASPPSVGPSGTFWLAVLEVAEAPDGLDDDTRRLAPVLGGALVVSPVACFASLPPAAGSGYLLGAAAADRNTLDDLLSAEGLTPRFLVRTRSGCVD
jgi:hypothetical protein